MDKLKGYFFVTLSVISFSLMVTLVKHLNTVSNIPPMQIAFFRFFIGFLVIASLKFLLNKSIKPNNLKNVLLRGFGNSFAVIVFFIIISMITVSKANIYNMTYPIFVAIIAHFYIKERMNKLSLLSVIIGFIGILFTMNIGFSALQLSDSIGIFSGLTAGFAIVCLKQARQTDESFTILFYVMGSGLLMTLPLMKFFYISPTATQLFLLIAIALLALLGQYFITYGYKFITALEGAIISSLRIVMVSILGIIFFKDAFTTNLIIGATLIMTSIIIINSKRPKSLPIKTKKTP